MELHGTLRFLVILNMIEVLLIRGTMVLPVGKYRVEAYLHGTDRVETQPITIRVADMPKSNSSKSSNSNLTLGFFYSPQKPVANPYDNDGECITDI